MATVPKTSTKHGVIGTLAIAAMVLVLAFQLAHWTWVFVAPAEVAAVPDGAPAINLGAVAKLFGADAPKNSSGAVAALSGLSLNSVNEPDASSAASTILSYLTCKDS